jgi:uncharacterized protein YggE
MKYSAIIFIALMGIATSGFSVPDDVLRTITVKGQSEIRVIPDQAILNIGVVIFKKDLGVAKNEHDRIVSSVLAAAKKAGVSKDHLKTDYLQIQPRYRDTGPDRLFLGYDVRQSIMTTVTDIERVEDILSSMLEAGANQVHGVEFRTSELRKHKDEARSLALDAAKEKAEAMGKQLGQSIGRPISITEESASRIIPSLSNKMRISGSGTGGGEGTMVAGRIVISARVSVKFELVE